MDPEYLFALVVFLLPVAAFSGWYYGRKDSSDKESGKSLSSEISSDYFRGLNHLLHDRPDKAIEVFIKVLEVDSETVETHLALGNLFRRRGEVDRAIRIHQNLVARPTLDVEQRALALLELGMDYMRSGLLDRAESLFLELLEIGMYERQTLRHLVDIYQQEQDWDRSLEFIRRLETVGGEDLRHVRAHFLCEKAAIHIEQGQLGDAKKLFDAALRTDRKCVRASLMAADLAMNKHDYPHAIENLKRIEHQDLEFVPEAIGRLVESYRAIDRLEDLSDYLRKLASLHTGITPVLVLAELAASEQGNEQAKSYIVEELKVRPTIRGIDRLIDYSLQGTINVARDDLLLVKETTRRLLEEKSSYKCGSCGFTGRSLHWQCPGCQAWNTVKPIHGIEGE